MTTKIKVPDTKFNTPLVQGSTDKAVKEAAATSTKMYRVPLAAIKPIPGFNVRVDSEEYLAHRDMLVNSIRVNGFDETKPLAGYVAKEGDKNVIYITDGYTRLDAVLAHNADPDVGEDEEITTLPVVVRPGVQTLEDLTVALHTNNSGKPLTPFELGVIVKRLLALDQPPTKARIASRLSVTARYLDDVVMLADAPAAVRSHILKGEFSSTAAIQELRKDPEQAAKRISAAVSKAREKGKVRATAKDIGPRITKVRLSISVEDGADIKDIVKAAAARIRECLPVSGSDDDAVKTVIGDGEIALVIAHAKPEAPAKKPARKRKGAAPTPPPAADDGGLPEGAEPMEPEAVVVAADEDEGELAVMPPVVRNGPGVDDAVNDDNI